MYTVSNLFYNCLHCISVPQFLSISFPKSQLKLRFDPCHIFWHCKYRDYVSHFFKACDTWSAITLIPSLSGSVRHHWILQAPFVNKFIMHCEIYSLRTVTRNYSLSIFQAYISVYQYQIILCSKRLQFHIALSFFLPLKKRIDMMQYVIKFNIIRCDVI